MKALAFAVLALAFALPLRAGNWLQNGDFVDGISHWYGDGRSPADFTAADPFAKADPFTSKGLIIPLKHVSWTKVAQDFKGKSASGVITITYMVAPDLTFSDKQDDYVNMPNHIGYNAWAPFNTTPGEWIVFLSDFGSNHGAYYEIKPNLGSGDPQKFQARISGLTPLADKTITLAFPPGKGNIVILDISMTDNER